MRDETTRGIRRWLRGAGLWLLLGIGLGGQRPAGAAEPFVVIVNAANPVSTVTGGELSSLFLKKVTQWSGGLPAVPVDLAPDSPARETFSHEIHHKGTAAVKAYWQQLIFSGREIGRAHV